MLQATIASGFVLSRAIVRDMVPTDQAASLIGYVTMGMSLMPMVGPMIGGFLDESFGWQAVFGFTFAFGLVTLALVWADLGRDQPGAVGELRRAVARLSRPLPLAAVLGLFGDGDAGLGGVLRLSRRRAVGGERGARHDARSQLGFHFGFIAVGYMVGNFLSGRYAGRVGINRMMLAGGIVATAGILLAVGVLPRRGGDAARLLRLDPLRRARQRPRCCRAPTPGSSRCGRTSPAPPRGSAAR